MRPEDLYMDLLVAAVDGLGSLQQYLREAVDSQEVFVRQRLAEGIPAPPLNWIAFVPKVEYSY
jgi:hypothetical protein